MIGLCVGRGSESIKLPIKSICMFGKKQLVVGCFLPFVV